MDQISLSNFMFSKALVTTRNWSICLLASHIAVHKRWPPNTKPKTTIYKKNDFLHERNNINLKLTDKG